TVTGASIANLIKRFTVTAPLPLCAHPDRCLLCRGGAAVEAKTHLLARLEDGNPLRGNIDGLARAGVAADAGVAVLARQGAEPAQFGPVTACERAGDLLENRVDDVLDIALIEVRILLGNPHDELGLDHIPRLSL